MSNSRFELPLAFTGHTALLEVTPETTSGWEVTTRVDGRVIGSVHCYDWRRVERYRARMQTWLQIAETSQHKSTEAA